MEEYDQQQHALIIRSINEELRPHYQDLVNLYRPDLRDETRAGAAPCDPIFPDLWPHYFPHDRLKLEPTEKEKDTRRVRVADLLITQLAEVQGDAKLPKRLLLVGQPESGKTALFSLLLHYWLHDKTKVTGLAEHDVLVAIQCLSLDLDNIGSSEGRSIDISKEVLARLPKSVKEHGEEKVREVLMSAKVLVLIDSLDCLSSCLATADEISFGLGAEQRILIFSRLKFLKECDPRHPLCLKQSQENLVLRLWGGITTNRFKPLHGLPEALPDLSGGLSGHCLEEYCKRLCQVHKKNFKDFWLHFQDQLKALALEMRKPFNIYMYFKEYCRNNKIKAKTPSELYGAWYDSWSSSYKDEHTQNKKLHTQAPDCGSLIMKATYTLSKLAYDAHITSQDYLPGEDFLKKDFDDFDKVISYFSHILVPHCNAAGKIQQYSFRVSAQKTFFIAKYIESQVSLKTETVETLMPKEAYISFISVLPMTLGVARGNAQYDTLKKHALTLAASVLDGEVTEKFEDPIVNYAVEIIAESGLYNRSDDNFISKVVSVMKENNWYILDGNLHPDALNALCKYGHSSEESRKRPQKIFFSFHGLYAEMPGLTDLLAAVRPFNIRIGLEMSSSLKGLDNQPLDKAIQVLHSRGQVSVGKFSGYLKDIGLLDSHPATRRLYNLSLRIHDQGQYNSLYRLCRDSNHLKRIFLRITLGSSLMVKKLKELPESITHLTMYMEGVDDETVNQSMAIWKAIRGSTKRTGQERLRFWATEGKIMTPEGALRVIEANLPAGHIEIPLQQPISSECEQRIAEKLERADSKIIIKLLGTVHYPRKDLSSYGPERS